MNQDNLHQIKSYQENFVEIQNLRQGAINYLVPKIWRLSFYIPFLKHNIILDILLSNLIFFLYPCVFIYDQGTDHS